MCISKLFSIFFAFSPNVAAPRHQTCRGLAEEFALIGMLCVIVCLDDLDCPLVSWNLFAVPIVQASGEWSSWLGSADDSSHDRSGRDFSYDTAFVFAMYSENKAKRINIEKKLQVLGERS